MRLSFMMQFMLFGVYCSLVSDTFHIIIVVRQENEREDQGEGIQNSGKTSTDVWGNWRSQK